MKYTRVTALAALAVAAAFSLTACDGDDPAADPSAQGPAASSPSSAASPSSPDGSAGTEGGSGSGGAEQGSGEGSGSGAGAAAGTGGKVAFCRTKDLAIDAVDAAPGKDSGRIDITMVNRGSTACSATGFAGVDIKDADNTSNPVPRGHAQPRVTVLKPGDAAVFDLAYDIDNSGGSLAHPTNLLVTPPNETHTVTLPWPEGAGDVKGAYTDVEVYPTHTV
ncbi:DUF4232 domain-containing protein [Streptomyces sp. NPDC092952]|uniref:DUF4232 domain-containing protein n=1 Tax=Streptomyces sp. NPDC092952 TaxID=3366018 RepID=UPI0038020F54